MSLAKLRAPGTLGLFGIIIVWTTLAQATNAEARERQNEIKVVGAGLGRTGGERLRKALDVLGYKTYHHMVIPNPHARPCAHIRLCNLRP